MAQGDSVAGNRNVFKAYKYLPTYPAFDGKDLTPGLPLELNPNIEECLDVSFEEITEGSFNIYPIPFETELNISLGNGINDNVQISIYTFDGRLVYHQTENQVGSEITLDMRTINSGTYLIELESEGNKLFKNIIKF